MALHVLRLGFLRVFTGLLERQIWRWREERDTPGLTEPLSRGEGKCAEYLLALSPVSLLCLNGTSFSNTK